MQGIESKILGAQEEIVQAEEKREDGTNGEKKDFPDILKDLELQDQFAMSEDPAKALSRLRQADADWAITNKVITPFNNYEKSVI
jgi:hypothetical protein